MATAHEESEVNIFSDRIQLDQLLKWMGVVDTGGQSRLLIDEGLVQVNGVLVKERRKKIYPGDRIKVKNRIFLVVKENKNGNED